MALILFREILSCHFDVSQDNPRVPSALRLHPVLTCPVLAHVTSVKDIAVTNETERNIYSTQGNAFTAILTR